jgi:hypothetical protein
MNETHCCCLFCKNPKSILIDQREEDLWYVVNEKLDSVHAFVRVFAYIELYYRNGVFDPLMPYLVWTVVMGDTTPPRSAPFGAFSLSMPDHIQFLPSPRRTQ